ncbi:magnesium transporter MRS2 homolog, mitochondrial isoform X2 [Leucoraja erinacea]|uniref:magnesium transporter MRS2 homolog, mitochondrial isoform X2 n=1 Tax=Leucoraja erinaceus TaxID=7782 RepID=UPI002455A328|nr:magnesium transporter MRS2 homolog, mitochondrial isoform X2 [Leucoraja erinacea]
MEVWGLTRSFFCTFAERAGLAFKGTPAKLRFFKYGCRCTMLKPCGRSISAFHTCALGTQLRLGISMNRQQQCHIKDSSQSALGSVVPVFSVVKYESTGNISFFERKKTELYQELGLQARDLRFQHLTSINTRNNCIILRMEISALQASLNELQPQILETLEALVNPKQMSIDRSKLHILLQDSKNLSGLETDVKVFKETLLEILDEEKLLKELCLTSEQLVSHQSNSRIDLTEEMELLLENYYRQAEDLANAARELKVLIDDSESIIFINLDSHRNVMMRLNLQLTMGTFSISLFGILGVAFGMNLESSFEEDPRFFWLVTGIMFLGSGLMWRRLLSFLGQHLEPQAPPSMPSILKRSQLLGGRVDQRHGSK